jgi:hypothetical protein
VGGSVVFEAIMAVLNAAKQNKLSKSTFALPGERKYPIPDRAHAANAKARAKQQLNAGNLSQSSYEQVVSKANRKLRGGIMGK